MKLNSADWLNKYYSEAYSDMSGKEALEHSYRKWLGLRVYTLEKYGLHIKQADVRDSDDDLILSINTSSCALCIKYLDTTDVRCEGCPLNLNGLSCDKGGTSPYARFLWGNNPNPMIKALKKALDECEE